MRGGAFIALVGPDGVGKTTVARALAERYDGPTAYFHFRPPLLARMAQQPPAVSPPPLSRGAPRGSRVLGWLRLARNFAGFWLGYLARVRPAVALGTLVIGDRCGYGYLVHPHVLRFYGPTRLADLAIRALPRPLLVANLRASPELIRHRKRELTTGEIEAELAAWAALPESRLKTFDADEAPQAIACRILHELTGGAR